MKITCVEGILLSAALSEEHHVRWSGGEMSVGTSALVRIHTDVGITGIGDTYAGGWFYPKAAKAMVEHFGALLVGKDPSSPSDLSQWLWHSSLYWARVGAGVNAISAIENALWDIAGRVAGVPVWKLLSDLRPHDSIPYYASGGLEKSVDATIQEMESYVEEGVPAVKIRVSTDIERAIAKVKLCRKALGNDIQLMVDAVMGSHPEPWDAATAIRFANSVEQYDITWLEEPCAGHDYAGYAAVRAATSIPISGGETSYGVHEFQHFFDAKALDIAQPDACTSGGISECMKIASIAAKHGLRVAPHAWGSAATVMANLHWAFVTPNVMIMEIPTWGYPLRDALLVEPLPIRDGRILPPTAPGLGVELTDTQLTQYAFIEGSGATMRRG